MSKYKAGVDFSGCTGEGLIPVAIAAAPAWVRMRTVGLKGVMGARSDPARIMVV